MGWTLFTAAASEPVTTAEAKSYLKVDFDSQDANIARLVSAARGYCEKRRDAQFVTATWDLTLDRFPSLNDRAGCDLNYPDFDRDAIQVWREPLRSVTSITYVDADGATQTLATAAYQVDTKSRVARIRPAYGYTWPTVRQQMNAVTVRMSLGYGDAVDVPSDFRLAILLLVAHWYRNPEAVITGTIATELELSVNALLGVDRLIRVS